jgi:hypothetical protein
MPIFQQRTNFCTYTKKMAQHPKMQNKENITIVHLISNRIVSVLLFVLFAIPFLIKIMLPTTVVRGTSALTAYMWLRTTMKQVIGTLGSTLLVHVQVAHNTSHLQV